MKKTKEKPEAKLTLKQKLFCDWYLKLANGTQAAIKAGYSEHTAQSIATENLTKPLIQAYINERKKHMEEILGFNKFTLVEDLHTIKRMSMKAQPVMRYNPKTREMEQVFDEVVGEDGKVQVTGVWQYDSNGANRAIENISKMMGYNEPDKVEDVTPLERKAPTTVVVNKTYADKESDKPTT
ncbi:terminase small subunit [Kouleothrix sp.]|uniref:terminase small subunit n=1 Tax=Kouleothrix sp. TaxID=2779161 RepID=UPI00391DCDDE